MKLHNNSFFLGIEFGFDSDIFGTWIGRDRDIEALNIGTIPISRFDPLSLPQVTIHNPPFLQSELKSNACGSS
jgi:hypothetical protein